MLDILSIIPPPAPTIRVLDIGAMIGGVDPYEPVRAAGIARVIGFESQAAECEKLNRTHGPRGLGELYQGVRPEEVQTARLDDLPDVRPIDLAKINTQDAELDVIRGGREALVIHTVQPRAAGATS